MIAVDPHLVYKTCAASAWRERRCCGRPLPRLGRRPTRWLRSPVHRRAGKRDAAAPFRGAKGPRCSSPSIPTPSAAPLRWEPSRGRGAVPSSLRRGAAGGARPLGAVDRRVNRARTCRHSVGARPASFGEQQVLERLPRFPAIGSEVACVGRKDVASTASPPRRRRGRHRPGPWEGCGTSP